MNPRKAFSLQFSLPFFSALLFAATGSWLARAETANPNFIIIVADDMGFSDLGCIGGDIQTPNLDSLAKNGLLYCQFYNAARCWPTRTSLMTGYYERTVSNLDSKRKGGGGFQDWVPFLPQQLKSQGYRAYMSGKFHVRGKDDPIDAGFDRAYFAKKIDRFWSPEMLIEDGVRLPIPDPQSGYHLTDAITEKAIGYLEQHQKDHREKPFFLYLTHMAPHWPLQAHQRDIDKYKDVYDGGWDRLREDRYQRIEERKFVAGRLSQREPDVDERTLKPGMYGPHEVTQAVDWNRLTQPQKDFQSDKFAIHAALVDHMDQAIGQVLEQVKSMGAFDNTVVFFISDNGASSEMYSLFPHDKTLPMGSPGTYLYPGPGWSTASNTPFRRHKAHTHEGGISTPLIVHWPAGIKKSGVRNQPGHVIDLMPTLIELAGATPLTRFRGKEIPLPIHGKSLVPTFDRNAQLGRECLYFEHQGCEAFRQGDWKIVHAKGSGWELYDLKTDRTETKDLALKKPEKLKDMVNAFDLYKNEIDLWKK